MKLRIGITIAAVVALVAASGLVWWHQRPKPTSPRSSQSSSQAKSAAKPELDPMAIDAIQQRSYPGSQVVLAKDLGEQGGYHSQIAAYQSDGFSIDALLAIPDSAMPSGGWPVIIFNHGYIDPSAYSTTSSYATWVAALAKGGFMVIKPDYRGNDRSQGQPEGGHFSPVYAYDVLNLVASVKNISGANPNRIGMFGHSMGGHETLRALVSSNQIKASVIAAGVVGSFNDIFYNWPNSPAPNDQPTALVQGKRQALIAKYGDPKANPDFWNQASAINYVSSVAGPVQVDVGTADAVVPKLFSDHLVQALQAAGKPVEYYTYPGADHNFSPGFNLLMSRSIAFFRAHL